MPKLVHKDKVERQKSWNYTEKHDLLQKNLGRKNYKSKSAALRDAGYKDVNSTESSKGIQEMLRERKQPERAIIRIDELQELPDDADELMIKLALARKEGAITTLKLSGDLKDRSETEHKGKIEVVNTTKNAITTILDRISGGSRPTTDTVPTE